MSKNNHSKASGIITFIAALAAALAILIGAASILPGDLSFSTLIGSFRNAASTDMPDTLSDTALLNTAEPVIDDAETAYIDDDEQLLSAGEEPGDSYAADEEITPSSDDTDAGVTDADPEEADDTVVAHAGWTEEDDDSFNSTANASPFSAEYANVQTITITAAGDCTLGGDTTQGSYKRFKKYFEELGPSYFLENVKSVFEDDDLTIVNLEGTFTETTNRKSKQYSFKGDYKFSRILTEGSVELVSIDNNHTQDYYAQGLADTKKTLNYIGVGYAGLGTTYTTEIKGVKIGFLSYRVWDMTIEGMTEAIRTMKESCDLVIVAIHWGDEKDYTASSKQVKLGHAAVDAGADLVLGTHPHVIQGIEIYNGKYIVYSLANFCFGGNQNPADKDTFIFQQTFTMANGEVIDSEISIFPCTISSTSTTNDYRPTIVDYNKGGAAILKKIANNSKQFNSVPDWNQVISKLIDKKDTAASND